MKNAIRFTPVIMAALWVVCPSLTAYAQHPSIGGYHVYYGHVHNHTSYSDGLCTPAEAYSYARDVAHLDFFGLADHTANSCDISDEEWDDTRAQANANNIDGTFVTFYGFEWTHDTIGHVTVVNPDSVGHKSGITDFAALVSWLSRRDVVAFFNHPGRSDSHGMYSYNSSITPSLQFVGMELWNRLDGFSVYYEDTGIIADDNRGIFDEALAKGWMIGPSGSGDDHSCTWGTAQDFRLAILAENLTRNDLYAAMKARRFYSTLESDISLSFKMDDHEMGSSIPAGSCTLQIQAADGGGDSFTTVVLYDKYHHRLKTWTPGTASFTIDDSLAVSAGDYYYVKVIQADSSASTGQAISSPIFISSMNSDGDQTHLMERYACINLQSSVGGGIPPYIYQWSPAAGLSSINTAQTVACLADSTNYLVTVKDASGCTVTEMISVNIDPRAGNAGAITGETTVCQGQQAVTYTVPPVLNATSYHWALPGGADGTSGLNTIMVNYGSSAISGNITVFGHNAYGDGSSASLAITVNPSFTFPEEHHICKGEVFRWQGSDYSAYGTYKAEYTTVAGCDSIFYLSLRVDSVDTGVTTDSSTLAADSSADAYQWLDCDNNFVPIEGATDQQFTATVTGHYAVKITQGLCIDTSEAISITLYPVYSFTGDRRICKGDTLHWQGGDYTTAGTYRAGYTTVHGRDSVYTLNLMVDSVDIGVTVDGITAVVDSSADAYQWLNCNNGYFAINGATDREFTPPIYGSFAVKITRGLCTDTSACVYIFVEGLNGPGTLSTLSVYPNPLSGELIIERKGNTQITDFEIINSMGRVIYHGNLTERTVLQTGHLVPGIYLLKLRNGSTMEFRKMIKE